MNILSDHRTTTNNSYGYNNNYNSNNGASWVQQANSYRKSSLIKQISFFVMSCIMIYFLFMLFISARETKENNNSNTVRTEQNDNADYIDKLIKKSEGDGKIAVINHNNDDNNENNIKGFKPILKNKIVTCGSPLQSNEKGIGLQCGITNQLFELVTCAVVASSLSAKKLILPNMCIDGNWGLCWCKNYQKMSKFLDFERLKTVFKQEFDLEVIETDMTTEYLSKSKHFDKYTISEPVLEVYREAIVRPLDESVKQVVDKINTNPNRYLSKDIINLGFMWGRWTPRSDDEINLYHKLWSAIQPSAIYRRIINDLLWKFKTVDNTDKFIVVHVQMSSDDKAYKGCQRSKVQAKDLVLYFLNEFAFPPKSSVLVIGSGLEEFGFGQFHFTILSDEKQVFTHTQGELLSQLRDHQLQNSILSFWMSLESDLFISTACESQFLSHILRFRQERKLPTCSTTEIVDTGFPHIYPQEYVKAERGNQKIPYFFPFPNIGNHYIVPRCSKDFISQSLIKQ
ncbi:hypothetical protein ABK040_008077 [Willaertia magna]